MNRVRNGSALVGDGHTCPHWTLGTVNDVVRGFLCWGCDRALSQQTWAQTVTQLFSSQVLPTPHHVISVWRALGQGLQGLMLIY